MKSSLFTIVQIKLIYVILSFIIKSHFMIHLLFLGFIDFVRVILNSGLFKDQISLRFGIVLVKAIGTIICNLGYRKLVDNYNLELAIDSTRFKAILKL